MRVSVPPFQVDPLYQKEYDRIDSIDASTRCKEYGLEPYNGPPRRIFFGTMVADENWDVLKIHAVEAHNIYYVSVFVESNTTHMATPRQMRYYHDSQERAMLQDSGMMGGDTKVYFEYWLEDMPDLIGMDRESEQRNTIVKLWKEAGMTENDVGLMADVDEFFSRGFLRALQICDFQEFRPGQNCQRPKIVPSTISFESSPYCFKKHEWFHPDVIGGQCIEGIGDPTERIVPLRTHKRRYGERHVSYGQHNLENYPEEVKKSNRYPLFSGPDIRTVHGDRGLPYNVESRPGVHKNAAYGVAFHLHNWFADLRTLRHKYKTYAHGDRNILQKTLSQASEDLDVFVRCARGLPNNANPNDWMREFYPDGKHIGGPKPIFFKNETYCDERHDTVRQMLREDEELYGSSYSFSGKWVENTLTVERNKREEEQRRNRTNASTHRSHVKIIGPQKREIPVGGNPESRHATVMGMATSLGLHELRIFVGSLRLSGFSGAIILGVSEDAPPEVLNYLARRNVTTKVLKYTNCTYEPFFKTQEDIDKEPDKRHVTGLSICAEPYPDVKVRWIKFPLGRDWLRECKQCTGPVLITDVRDVLFQGDPFGPDAPVVEGLQVFEEHPDLTTAHWLVDWPVGDCKGVHTKEPMLCSGTTIGTLDAMMKYLDAMYGEMKRWITDPKCRFITLADDQSIHNWLFYNGDLKGAQAIRHREGIVHTVGYESDKIFQGNIKKLMAEKNLTYDEAYHSPIPGQNDHTWISSDIYKLTDEDGYFTNFDGSRSLVVHQWDRAAEPFIRWMTKQPFLNDELSSVA
jgi:hypothetical protein